MKLNGWHRLWIVLAAAWSLPVLTYTYLEWPIAGSITKADVYARMKSDDAKRFVDYYDVLAAKVGGTSPRYTIEDPGQQSNEGLVVQIDGRTVQFVNGVSREDMNLIAGSYHAALLRILAIKREALAIQAFALWMVPAVMLYALGWAIGWIRRGFRGKPPGSEIQAVQRP